MPSGAWNALDVLGSLDWTRSSILVASRSTFTPFMDHQVRLDELKSALGDFIFHEGVGGFRWKWWGVD